MSNALLYCRSTDRRTKSGQEREILQKIIDNGGFSIFWVTAHQMRANAATRLEESGTIIRGKDNYPWCKYTIYEKNKT